MDGGAIRAKNKQSRAGTGLGEELKTGQYRWKQSRAGTGLGEKTEVGSVPLVQYSSTVGLRPTGQFDLNEINNSFFFAGNHEGV